MSKSLSLEKCKLDNEWDKFINNSPDQSIFVTKNYLESLNTNLGLYKCFKGEEIRAIVVLCEDDSKRNNISNDLLIYSGICFGPPTNNQNYSQQLSERFSITNFIINKLTQFYDSLNFQLSPNFIDIRPFLWHNYGEECSRKFSVDIRYTSYLNIEKFKSPDLFSNQSLLNNLSSSRRQQIRYSIKNNIKTKLIDDIDLFLMFYKKTLLKSNIKLSSYLENNFRLLISNLLNSEKAKMYLSLSKDCDPASIAIVGIDKLRAYYLFGANDPEVNEDSSGTAVLFYAFNQLAKNGINYIDLEGVNSPRRGWFKLSFGGKLIPYFRINYPNR
tara:strand:+ start:14440 stop:15426 length:987 start_codon:yes stop_codon:yes gene_type:complete